MRWSVDPPLLAGTLAVAALAVGLTACGEPRSTTGTTSLADADAVPGPSRQPAAATPSPSPTAPSLKRYTGPVEHLTFPHLIADPGQAFTGADRDRLNEQYLTVGEFTRILRQLYEDDYVLVSISSLVQRGASGEPVAEAPLLLPVGKKPLVISVEDPGASDVGAGATRRLVLDREGDVTAESRGPDGRDVVSAATEVVPVLDRFVAQRPDFSFRGAKGVVVLTGMTGVLGYRTSSTPVTGPDADRAVVASPRETTAARKAVSPVIQRLRATGWTFASAGYTQPDVTRIRPGALARDARLWRREVGVLVGPTPVYVLPDDAPAQPSAAALRALTKQGFRLLSAPDALPGLVVTNGYSRLNRVDVDGAALLGNPDDLRRVLDPDAVTDPARPALRVTPTPQQPTN